MVPRVTQNGSEEDKNKQKRKESNEDTQFKKDSKIQSGSGFKSRASSGIKNNFYLLLFSVIIVCFYRLN